MKYLQRYLSLLVALALSVALFFIPVNAAENYENAYTFDFLIRYFKDSATGSKDFWEREHTSHFVHFSGKVQNFLINSESFWHVQIQSYPDDGDLIALKGQTVEFSLTGYKIQTDYDKGVYGSGSKIWMSPQFYVQLLHDDGSVTTLQSSDIDLSYSSGTEKLSFTGKFTAAKPVSKLIFGHTIYPYNKYGMEGTYTYFETTLKGDPMLLVTVVEDKQVGLLEGIKDKLTSGFDSVVNGVKDVWKTCEAGFANIVKGITELPQKIWSVFENGLKSLFVPSDDDIVAYKDKWDQLLSSRLGAVYQVTDILHNSWDEVMSADEINTISIPSATINLPDDASFTFGGYEVEIVPEGFDFLVTSIKIIVGIVCSVAFINGMRKRYDEVMGVEA